MLNKELQIIHENLDNYIKYDCLPTLSGNDEENWVLDIEACPTSEEKKEVLVYSIAIMDCNNSNIMYKYNNVDKCLDDLLNIDSRKINIYIHNLFYDIKPFMISLFSRYGNNPILRDTYEKTEYNKFEDKEETWTYEKDKLDIITEKYQYSTIIAKGQLYCFNVGGREITRKVKVRNKKFVSVLSFKDSYKIFPFSLQDCCEAYLGLKLPKDGLDYDKIRQPDDILTKEELIYIYNDVYGLSKLVKAMVIDGYELNGRIIKNEKITASGQALYDYKKTIEEDYKKRQNAFANEDVFWYVDNNLFNNGSDKAKTHDKELDCYFKALYPTQNIFEYQFTKHSYFGGLSLVDFENVRKFEKLNKKDGLVFDVNSLYPSMMVDTLLPYGKGYYLDKPYEQMDDLFKEQYPLYIQELYIYDMKVKEDKIHWVQVKDRKDYNGREVIKENINLNGEKTTIRLVLTNVLLDLLFECYDVNSYELGKAIAYKGTRHLFDNYISYWSEVKKNNKGAMRTTAKNRLNTLYGKFGSNCCSETELLTETDNVFKIEHIKNFILREPIYLPMATFITSYAKRFLVQAINANREYFVYCDTDSMHLICNYEDVKGIKIHDKDFSCWDNEMKFSDFKYLGSKRYAEKDKETNKWFIKCCGLTDKIMKQVDNIDLFDYCEIPKKELDKMVLYTKDDSVYYYRDKECKEPIKGLFKSKKARQVKGGTLIITQPYEIIKYEKGA